MAQLSEMQEQNMLLAFYSGQTSSRRRQDFLFNLSEKKRYEPEHSASSEAEAAPRQTPDIHKKPKEPGRRKNEQQQDGLKRLQQHKAQSVQWEKNVIKAYLLVKFNYHCTKATTEEV